MTTKQHAITVIVCLLLTVGLLWGAWYECGPFTWTILCLIEAAFGLRILAAGLGRKSNEALDDALGAMRATLAEMRRKNDLKEGGDNDRG